MFSCSPPCKALKKLVLQHARSNPLTLTTWFTAALIQNSLIHMLADAVFNRSKKSRQTQKMSLIQHFLQKNQQYMR